MRLMYREIVLVNLASLTASNRKYIHMLYSKGNHILRTGCRTAQSYGCHRSGVRKSTTNVESLAKENDESTREKHDNKDQIFVEAARLPLEAPFTLMVGEATEVAPTLEDRACAVVLGVRCGNSEDRRDPEAGSGGWICGASSSSPAAILRACVKNSLASRSAIFSMK